MKNCIVPSQSKSPTLFLWKLLVLFIAVSIISACANEDGPQPEPVLLQEDAASAEHLSADAKLTGNRNFVTHLSGDEEVPPADTKAQGQAIFQLSKDGTQLSYKLIVANIENVTMAHIHVAPAGVNGPVVVWLYPSGPPPQLIPGRSNGVLATGVITAANLVGQLAGQPLNNLVAAMRAGNTYVNVHTSQYPGGEIRGQIRAVGNH
jgi:hypothetical protein